MNKGILAIAVLVAGIFANAEKTQAAGVCELEGLGQFELTCDNQKENLQIYVSGMSAGEGDRFTVKNGNSEYKIERGPELPDYNYRAFERVDEGVLTLGFNHENYDEKKSWVFYNLVGIPRTFKIRTASYPGEPRASAIEMTGTFTATLYGAINDKYFDTTVTCKVSVVDCPRKKVR